MKNYKQEITLPDLLWEIPISCLSFLFYKATRFFLQIMTLLDYMRRRGQTPVWRVLAAELLTERFTLPRVMTTGPRWNTHAIIGILGPLEVSGFIKIQMEKVVESARSWTIVVYEFPGAKTVASINSLDSHQTPWETLELAAGRYMIFLRYYDWAREIELPDVHLDEETVIPSRALSRNVNDFYNDLGNRRTWFYFFLSHYVFNLLRFRKWLPEAFVEKEYLPVGNPRTRFCYGLVKSGDFITFEVDSRLLQTSSIYFTLYDRASFPVIWYRIQERRHTTARSISNGFFLLRIHDDSPARTALPEAQVHVIVSDKEKLHK